MRRGERAPNAPALFPADAVPAQKTADARRVRRLPEQDARPAPPRAVRALPAPRRAARRRLLPAIPVPTLRSDWQRRGS